MKFKKIKYLIDSEEFEEVIDIDMKFSSFTLITEVMHKINLNLYESFYQNAKLDNKKKNWFIKDLIIDDNNPIFYFKKIKHDHHVEDVKNLEELKKSQIVEIKICGYSSKVELMKFLEEYISNEINNIKFFDTEDEIIIHISGLGKGMSLFGKLNNIKSLNKNFSCLEISLKIINKRVTNKSTDNNKIIKKIIVMFFFRIAEYGILPKILDL